MCESVAYAKYAADVCAERCRQNARYPRANIQIIVEKGRSLNKKC